MRTAIRTRLYHLNVIAVLVFVALLPSACVAVQQSTMGAGTAVVYLEVGGASEQP